MSACIRECNSIVIVHRRRYEQPLNMWAALTASTDDAEDGDLFPRLCESASARVHVCAFVCMVDVCWQRTKGECAHIH